MGDVGDGFGGVVVPLIEMHDVGNHPSRDLNHHPIHIWGYGGPTVALFERPAKLGPVGYGYGCRRAQPVSQDRGAPEARLSSWISPKADRTSRTDSTLFSARLRHRDFPGNHSTHDGRMPRAPPNTGVEPNRRFCSLNETCRRCEIRPPKEPRDICETTSTCPNRVGTRPTRNVERRSGAHSRLDGKERVRVTRDIGANKAAHDCSRARTQD